MLHRLLWLALILGSQSLFAANEDVKQWLDKMVAAERFLNYQGTFIYTNGPQVETMQIVHGFDKQGERERMSSLTGDVREIIRDESHLVSVLPVRKEVLIEPRGKQLSSPANLLEGLEKSEAFYDYSLKGEERIAGHVSPVRLEQTIFNISKAFAHRIIKLIMPFTIGELSSLSSLGKSESEESTNPTAVPARRRP